MTTVVDVAMKRKAKDVISSAVGDCMSTYWANYADMIAALASVTAELCVEQAQARTHAESCAAREGRYLCTCGVGDHIPDITKKVIPPLPEPMPPFEMYPPTTTDGSWTLPESIYKRLRIMFGRGA